MPTISELVAADVSADDDLFPMSQGGAVRSVTRAQLLAGMQPELSLSSGALLGRVSPGMGEPERVALGANLRLTNGVLSALAPFSVSRLPGAAGVGLADLVAVSQGGQDAAMPVGLLLAGLTNVPGVDVSGQVVRVDGGQARRLADWAADALPVEAFGAAGDGVTDDQAALDRAVASGRPVRLGPKTYAVSGQWTVTRAASLYGVAGRTVLKRTSQSGGAWISVGGPSFSACGIEFDAGGLGGDSWCVLVTPPCTQTLFENCIFRRSTGPSLGSGLVIQARDGLTGAPSRHVVRGCEASDNAVHGIWIQAACGARVESCLAHGNGAYGICLDFNDPAFQHTVRNSQVVACRAWGNQRGISVGNFNEINLEPPRWGNANPDAVNVLVAGNVCHDNRAYGIAVAGLGLQVCGNQVQAGSAGAAGVLVNASESLVSDNVVSGPGAFGIDAGGCISCDIVDNVIRRFAVGINPGGSSDVRVAGNGLIGNVWGITAYQMETDGHGHPFGIACQRLSLTDNTITLSGPAGGGIYLLDGPQDVLIARNSVLGGIGTTASQGLWARTDRVAIRENSWNNQTRLVFNPVTAGGLQQVQFPDLLDAVMLTSAPQGVSSIVGQHQASMNGLVSFVRVTNGGSGYTQATVTISGTGVGAGAIAYVRDGTVIAVAMVANGYGYGSAAVTVSLSGDGRGATAEAVVGLPVPEGRRLRLHCNSAIKFKRAGSVPFQDNWTSTDMTVPAASVVEWMGAWGGWQATSFPCADYVAPTGDGGVVVRSVAGDMTLRPAAAGRVRVGSEAEPAGFVSTLGRGSPEGVVAAPPGSDYRNLDGGVGATLWLKRSGTGASGWSAIG